MESPITTEIKEAIARYEFELTYYSYNYKTGEHKVEIESVAFGNLVVHFTSLIDLGYSICLKISEGGEGE